MAAEHDENLTHPNLGPLFEEGSRLSFSRMASCGVISELSGSDQDEPQQISRGARGSFRPRMTRASGLVVDV
jgi:hypothetical protein